MKVGSTALLLALGSSALTYTTTDAFVPTSCSPISTSFLSTTQQSTGLMTNAPRRSNSKNTIVMMAAQVPLIDNWRVLRSGKLTGTVTNHPTYEDGEVITTSMLADPKSSSDGIVVATISGSKYKLGKKYGTSAKAPKTNGKAQPKQMASKKPAISIASKNIFAAKKAAVAKPMPTKTPPSKKVDPKQQQKQQQASIEQQLREARKKYSLTGSTVGDQKKYLLSGNAKRSTSGKSQIWTAYRADENGLPTGDPVTVKLSANFDAIRSESSNYDKVTSGLFAGRFVNKIEFLPEADPENKKSKMANLCALIIENGDVDLKAFMQSRNKVGLKGKAMRDAAAAAGQCVQAMHSSNMVWTDLKTENFVVQGSGSASGDGALSVKGIDLESARPIKGNPVDYSPEACPPEFANAFISGNGQSFILETSYDMWSLGMMLYEVSVGKPYFDGKSPVQITKALRYEDFEADVSAVKDDKLRDLIGQCLKFNPKERPSITTFLLHPYFLTTGIGPFSF